jgi:hypothetical protein
VPARLEAEPVDDEVAAIMAAEARVRGRIVAAEDGLVVVDTGTGPGGELDARARRLLDAARAHETGASVGDTEPSPGA